tara:strand:- start:1474 stop:3324 length:1851 start_codon:yes stop_codon:yes gene_type:complete
MNNFLAKIKEEKKVIKKILAKKNINRNLDLINNYQLSETSYDNLIKSINLNLKKNKNTTKINLIIISNYTKEIFANIIKENFLKRKILVNILYFDFNSVLSNKISLSSKIPNIFLIYCGHDDFIKFSSFDNQTNYNNSDINTFIQHLKNIVDIVTQIKNTKIFISNFSNFPNSEFGNYTSFINNNKFQLIEKLNYKIKKLVNNHKINLIDNWFISNQYGLKKLEEVEMFYVARIPFSISFANNYYFIFSNLVSISLGNTKKVLILDLDNTLWGGILGDDGYEGIEIGNDTPLGNMYLDFQKIIKNLKKRGILLAICSKNSLSNVKEAFKKNKNMILKYNDFVSIKANWQDKHKNILKISEELNLGLDSFVFIDDSPMERDIVRENLPEVTVPELPPNPSAYKDIIIDRLYFDLTNLSKEDKKRSKSYISENKRIKLRNKFKSDVQYFNSLEMTANVKSFSKNNIDRIVQLFQRSNQFNLTTTRYSHTDIQKFIKDNDKIFTLQIGLKDKFSDYGIISLIVCEKDKSNLLIKNWVMSCRVLNRSLESFILNEIIIFCKKKKILNLNGIYIPTKKNILVKNLYNKLGFRLINKKKNTINYTLNVYNYKPKNTYIKLKN